MNLSLEPLDHDDGVSRGRDTQDWMEWILGYQSGRVIVLKVGIDEGVTHTENPVLAVAACMTTSRQWGLFVEEWRGRLKGKVPEGKVYHAQEGWCEGPDGLNDQLAELALRRMQEMYVFTVLENDYREHASHDFRSRFGSAYSVGILGCLSYIATTQRRARKPQKAAYMIESGHKNQAMVSGMLEDMMNMPDVRENWYLHSYSFVGKEEPILHPSDLVAHEWATSYGRDASPRMELLSAKVQHVHMEPEDIRRHVTELWARIGPHIAAARKTKKSRRAQKKIGD